jgi:polysaccharide biosynthesis transport protein
MNRHQLPPARVPAAKVPRDEISAQGSLWNITSAIPNDSRIISDSVSVSSSDLLLRYWKLVKRRKFVIACIALIGALGGFLLAARQTPQYQARLLLEVQSLNEDFLNMRAVDPTQVNYAADSYLQTQVKILQSDSLLERVVEKLQLDKRPEMNPQRDSVKSTWRSKLGFPLPGPISPKDAARRMVADNLTVRATGMTRIIEIHFAWTDPKTAAELANVLATEFINENLESRWKTTQQTGEWLRVQLKDTKSKLEQSEAELNAYAKNSGLQLMSDQGNMAEAKLKQIQEEISRASADRAAKQSRFELVESSPPDTLPEVLDDASLRDFQIKLADLNRQLAEATSSLASAHPKVERLQAQISEMRSVLEKHRANILSRIRNEYNSARTRESLLEKAYEKQNEIVTDQSSKSIHYNILKREVETNRQVYDGMLQRVKEAGVASALRASNVRIVDPAKPPHQPYKPQITLNVGIGLLLGLFFGVIFVVMRAGADTTFKPGDAPLFLNLPELGIIPSFRSFPFSRKLGIPMTMLLEEGTNGDSQDGKRPKRKVELVTLQKKSSFMSESFFGTLTSVLFSDDDGIHPSVVLITSPNPEEGKTMTACNLAITWAEMEGRILLIDGDLRRPKLHGIFDVPNDWGLSELLHDEYPIDEYPLERLVCGTSVNSLYVLPGGRETSGVSRGLRSPRMAKLLRRLRGEFDTVLIDSPPLLPLSDARVLARLVDAVILVIRSGRTTRESALAARKRLLEDGAPLIGSILTDCNPKNEGVWKQSYDGYCRYYGSAKK